VIAHLRRVVDINTIVFDRRALDAGTDTIGPVHEPDLTQVFDELLLIENDLLAFRISIVAHILDGHSDRRKVVVNHTSEVSILSPIFELLALVANLLDARHDHAYGLMLVIVFPCMPCGYEDLTECGGHRPRGAINCTPWIAIEQKRVCNAETVRAQEGLALRVAHTREALVEPRDVGRQVSRL
jgi:hypothetical protein